ncbi:unnamed protein product [Callosobruchus maculatus]|uniref:Major facilitator superfamily (MFS) profile domain-containing protein n=1 Tax=Callosobruchus maculatus TaxID=64391 RepID=A0A653BDR7_CALMS|nr:unnamed protein product [Callosobruchus maculatus]
MVRQIRQKACSGSQPDRFRNISRSGTYILSLRQTVPWYLALCSLPETVTGSFPTFFTMVLSYISDTSTEENRAMRMVVFEAIVTVGSLLGSMGGPYIFYMTSYQAIFGIAAICHFIALLYTWFLVPESVTNIETENKIKEFFVLDNVKDMMKRGVEKTRTL